MLGLSDLVLTWRSFLRIKGTEGMEFSFLLCLAVSQHPNGASHRPFLLILFSFFFLFFFIAFNLKAKKIAEIEGENLLYYVFCCLLFAQEKVDYRRYEVQLL